MSNVRRHRRDRRRQTLPSRFPAGAGMAHVRDVALQGGDNVWLKIASTTIIDGVRTNVIFQAQSGTPVDRDGVWGHDTVTDEWIPCLVAEFIPGFQVRVTFAAGSIIDQIVVVPWANFCKPQIGAWVGAYEGP